MLLQFNQPIPEGPGIDTFSNHSLEIIIILLGAFILGWILRWFFMRHYKTRMQDLEQQVAGLKKKNMDLDGELHNCNATVVKLKGDLASRDTNISALEGEVASLKSQLSSSLDNGGDQTEVAVVQRLQEELADCHARVAQLEAQSFEKEEMASAMLMPSTPLEESSATDFSEAISILGKQVRQDDLQIVEGIGPKTAVLLNNSGIKTWNQLANQSVPDIQQVLAKGGERFKLLNPSTWPRQAELADKGQWVDLKEYQDYLIGGVDPEKLTSEKKATVVTGIPTFDAAAAAQVLGKPIKFNDLTIIEGIGPKISELLHEHGINTWRELADAAVDKLQGILDSKGERYRVHNPQTWPRQAQLADDGNWDELLKYQDYLDGGKIPD